jgi:hypothetical protein
VDLTVLGKTYYTYKESACKLYTLPSGKNSYTKSAIIQDTIKNQLGCDSVITIDLTVIKVGTGVSVTGDVLTCTNTAATDWQWVLCNQNYKAATDGNTRIYNAKTNGNYAVIVTQDNCTDTSECYWITSAAINNFAKQDNGLIIYPNPINQNELNLQIEVPMLVNQGKLRLVNTQGRVLIEQPFTGKRSSIVFKETIASGLYIVELQTENWISKTQLMVH